VLMLVRPQGLFNFHRRLPRKAAQPVKLP
jgi:hypothetical protein